MFIGSQPVLLDGVFRYKHWMLPLMVSVSGLVQLLVMVSIWIGMGQQHTVKTRLSATTPLQMIVIMAIQMEYTWYVDIFNNRFQQNNLAGIIVSPTGSGVQYVRVYDNWFNDCIGPAMHVRRVWTTALFVVTIFSTMKHRCQEHLQDLVFILLLVVIT